MGASLDACGVECYAILKEHYAEGAKSLRKSHLMERVKYTQAYKADTEPFWQTWHTAVYDLANKTLRLNIQEDYSKHYDFKLD